MPLPLMPSYTRPVTSLKAAAMRGQQYAQSMTVFGAVSFFVVINDSKRAPAAGPRSSDEYERSEQHLKVGKLAHVSGPSRLPSDYQVLFIECWPK